MFVGFLSELSVQNVMEYHAEIDGAILNLADKIERLSLVDRDLVQKADDHAAELERQANELEEWEPSLELSSAISFNHINTVALR